VIGCTLEALMQIPTRREFLQTGGALGAAAVALGPDALFGDVPDIARGARPSPVPGVEVLHPRDRVPLSFIIDDSTCLVNMGHYCMPQFAEAWPERQDYKKPWKTWPREIPDDFVREFGEWCAAHDVKGKYSVVPNPACVGWLDRELPGWSRSELQASLKLVRELMLPNWDIHPEMITHTRMIDLKTGRPFPEISAATMENWYPREDKSVDELASYMAYALRILRNCDLPCEGITTPGGFGSNAEASLSRAVDEAVRDVFGAEIPHYFKYVAERDESPAPRVENVRGLGTDDVRLVVNVPAAAGDWFGGWEGDEPSRGHLYADAEAKNGRMVELIEAGGPAIMYCHWPGLYTHGTKDGLRDFQEVVVALDRRFGDQTVWMKLSEIARYQAAKELTAVTRGKDGVALDAPFACPAFTLRLGTRSSTPPSIHQGGQTVPLKEARARRDLSPGTWLREAEGVTVCFDLGKGKTTLHA
jgi:hypothetical protein